MAKMSSNQSRRRVRIVKDPGKVWRHRLKKQLRKALKPAFWVGAVAFCMFMVWLVLQWMFRQG
jgi:hypothetical protein